MRAGGMARFRGVIHSSVVDLQRNCETRADPLAVCGSSIEIRRIKGARFEGFCGSARESDAVFRCIGGPDHHALFGTTDLCVQARYMFEARIADGAKIDECLMMGATHRHIANDLRTSYRL